MKSYDICIIGAGPAGLMAAERLSELGLAPTIYDGMPSPARKLLMAGKSGLNITHTEPSDMLLRRYRNAGPAITQAIAEFGADEIRDWMHDLGVSSFVGSTGRVFPSMMKASPLLRAWLSRLEARGISVIRRHRWLGWDNRGNLRFDSPDGEVKLRPSATILAVGGGSWRRLGSDGAWAEWLKADGAPIDPFVPSNGGFRVEWSDVMRSKFSGAAVKSTRLSVKEAPSASTRGEFVITEDGIEGGAIYALSADLFAAIQNHSCATLLVDLAPDRTASSIEASLAKSPPRQSMSNTLRKAARLTPVKIGLLREAHTGLRDLDPSVLAAHIKSVPIQVTGTAPIDDAISTAGGVAWSGLDDQFMLHCKPGVFCAGEMIAWDAPTGGYLLTACLASGRAAAEGAASFLRKR